MFKCFQDVTLLNSRVAIKEIWWYLFILITARQQNCGKVMFSVVCVSLSVHGGGGPYETMTLIHKTQLYGACHPLPAPVLTSGGHQSTYSWQAGGMHQTEMHFSGCNEVVAKVMFLFVSVILSTGGSASVHAGIIPCQGDPLPRRPPAKEIPLPKRPPAN